MISGYNEENAKKIINFFKNKGFNDNAIAGLLGNLYSESKLYSNNLQNCYEAKTKLNMSDAEYTAAVDKGTYTQFCTDKAGYGLAQWTSAGRKTGLYNFIKSKNKSIGDEYSQIEYLYNELTSAYKNSVLKELQSPTNTIRSCAEVIVCKYEIPASVLSGPKSKEETIVKRTGFAQDFYDKYLKTTVSTTASTKKEQTKFTNSPLVSYTNISPYKTENRTHEIDTITIHCYCGQVTVERGVDGFKNRAPGKEASCNYVIGTEGKIGLVVEEKDRSWCSSNAANDHRAITIECASDTTAPYKVNDKVFNSLIQLCADICKRNNIKELKWKADKSLIGKVDKQNMTVHRWFANKSCPGDYLFNKHPEIAEKVNNILRGGQPSEPVEEPAEEPETPSVKVDPAKSKEANLAGTYQATARLNVRAGAGMDKNILCVIEKGTTMKNYGFYTAIGNTKWYLVQLTYNGKIITGYVCSDWVKKI